MATPGPPTLATEFEELLRSQLKESCERYRAAAEQYERLLKERSGGTAPDSDGALTLARQAESQAQIQYMRVLRIFTDLVVHGKIPAERGAAGWEDV